MVEHVVITDPNIHEPKGASTATVGQAYVADGAGSGDWEDIFQYGGIYTVETDAVSVATIGTTAKTLPFSNDSADNIVVSDAANDRITLTQAGTYMVHFSLSYATAAAGDAGLYEFKLALDGVSTGHAAYHYSSGANDSDVISTSALITATAGQQLTVRVESDEAGNTDDINIYYANLSVYKVD